MITTHNFAQVKALHSHSAAVATLMNHQQRCVQIVFSRAAGTGIC